MRRKIVIDKNYWKNLPVEEKLRLVRKHILFEDGTRKSDIDIARDITNDLGIAIYHHQVKNFYDSHKEKIPELKIKMLPVSERRLK